LIFKPWKTRKLRTRALVSLRRNFVVKRRRGGGREIVASIGSRSFDDRPKTPLVSDVLRFTIVALRFAAVAQRVTIVWKGPGTPLVSDVLRFATSHDRFARSTKLRNPLVSHLTSCVSRAFHRDRSRNLLASDVLFFTNVLFFRPVLRFTVFVQRVTIVSQGPITASYAMKKHRQTTKMYTMKNYTA
jgi:hypothetical protein